MISPGTVVPFESGAFLEVSGGAASLHGLEVMTNAEWAHARDFQARIYPQRRGRPRGSGVYDADPEAICKAAARVRVRTRGRRVTALNLGAELSVNSKTVTRTIARAHGCRLSEFLSLCGAARGPVACKLESCPSTRRTAASSSAERAWASDPWTK